MDVLTFIATLVQALAWPVVVVILALILRRQLRAMVAQLADRMKTLKTLKAPGTALEFEDTLIEVKDQLARLPEQSERFTITRGDYLINRGDYFHLEHRKPSRESLKLPASDTAITDSDGSKIFQFTEELPEATVISSWVIFESGFRGLARRLNIDATKDSFTELALTVIDTLENRCAFAEPANLRSIMLKLYRLRNVVAHGAKITKLEAYDYASTAMQLAKILTDAYLKTATQEDGQPK